MPAARDWFERAIEKTTFDADTGCWLYHGEIVHNGYGRVWHDGKNVRLHRLSFECFVGEIPEGILVCHKCDVRNCWNPQHLFLGTVADNNHDALAKGRATFSPVLTEDDVRDIRHIISSTDLRDREIADRYGVGRAAIMKIRHGQTWAWLV